MLLGLAALWASFVFMRVAVPRMADHACAGGAAGALARG
jgi:hypothetical protein